MSDNHQLVDDINAFQQEVIPTLSSDTLDALMGSISAVQQAGTADGALNVGDTIPDFSLQNAHGEQIDIKQCIASGPLVISFYRGAWCPYCNLEIKAQAAHLNQIRELGADLIAISPQVASKAEQQSTALSLNFNILSDVGNQVSKQFGLTFSLTEDVRPVLDDEFKFDIQGHNADDKYELPIPATYIVDQQGVIRFAFVDADYTKRLEPEVILEQLRALA